MTLARLGSDVIRRDSIEQPGIGKGRVGGSPLPLAATQRDETCPAPQLGHSEQIQADDLSACEIAALRDRGVTPGPSDHR
jgi:2-methylfumaryl-CoA isomerase